jgi:hypothetical protein
MRVLPMLALWVIVACGGGSRSGDPPREPGRRSPHDPRLPPSATAERVKKSLGRAPQSCGEAVQGIDDRSCRMLSVFECLLSAYEVCRPAYGTHMYATAEGDPIRIDYYVRPANGPCAFMVVEDRSADPVGSKGVQELSCTKIEWKSDPANPSCQALSPLDCRSVSGSQ